MASGLVVHAHPMRLTDQVPVLGTWRGASGQNNSLVEWLTIRNHRAP